MQKDRQFVRNKLVKHLTFSIVCRQCRGLHVCLGKLENYGNLISVKHLTNSTSLFGGEFFVREYVNCLNAVKTVIAYCPEFADQSTTT